MPPRTQPPSLDKSAGPLRRAFRYAYYDWTREMPRSKRLIAWAGILLQGYAIYCMWSGSLTAVAFNGTGGDNEFYSTAPGNNWTDAYADTYEYGYSYNPTGRVTTRKMGVKATSYNTYNI